MMVWDTNAQSGKGGQATGKGGQVTGKGGQTTGKGGQVTGIGGQVTGIGGQATGIGGQATGIGGQVTGKGGQATGKGGQATGEGVRVVAGRRGWEVGRGRRRGALLTQQTCALTPKRSGHTVPQHLARVHVVQVQGEGHGAVGDGGSQHQILPGDVIQLQDHDHEVPRRVQPAT